MARCSSRLILHVSCDMPHAVSITARTLVGVVSLFAAFALGGYLGDLAFPQSAVVGGRESLAGKTGGSVAILIASLLLGRYVLRSVGSALLCLAATEIIALLIIVGFSGLTTLTMADISFNAWWLYAVTWNVVLAFLLGAGFGLLWSRRAANPQSGADGRQPSGSGTSRTSSAPDSGAHSDR